MYFVTVVNAVLVVWAARQQSRRVSLGLYVYLSILVALLLLIIFGIPIPLLGAGP